MQNVGGLGKIFPSSLSRCCRVRGDGAWDAGMRLEHLSLSRLEPTVTSSSGFHCLSVFPLFQGCSSHLVYHTAVTAYVTGSVPPSSHCPCPGPTIQTLSSLPFIYSSLILVEKSWLKSTDVQLAVGALWRLEKEKRAHGR